MVNGIIRSDGAAVAARLGRLLEPLGGSRLVLAGAGGALGIALRAVIAAYNHAHSGRPIRLAAFDRLPAGGAGPAEWIVNLLPGLRAVWTMLDQARGGQVRGLLSLASPGGGEGWPPVEALCATHWRLYRTPVAVLRPFGVYGPGQGGMPLVLPWDGAETASFCYAAEAAEACLVLLVMAEAHGQVFDLAGGDTVTPGQLVAAAALAGLPPPVVLGGGLRRQPEPARLIRLTGLRPRIGLAEGLARTRAAGLVGSPVGAVNRA